MGGVAIDNAPGRNWGRLMAAAQEGDADAYRILLSELAVWLRRYYARRLPPAMTDDAVRDVLLAIHEKRHTYDPGHPFEPWLAAIAHYKWIDRLRSLKSEAAERLNENSEIPDHGDSVVAGSAFQQLLAELTPRQAEVIRLVKLEGYSVEEASHATGQSISLIKVNILRGIKRLADIIEATDNADRLPRRPHKPSVARIQAAQGCVRNAFARFTRFFRSGEFHPQPKGKLQ